MGKLKQSNPEAYNMINTAMKSGKDPEKFMNELIRERNISPEQLARIKENARSYGAPEDILKKLG